MHGKHLSTSLTFSAKVNDGSYRPPIGLAAAKILQRACKILENKNFKRVIHIQGDEPWNLHEGILLAFFWL